MEPQYSPFRRARLAAGIVTLAVLMPAASACSALGGSTSSAAPAGPASAAATASSAASAQASTTAGAASAEPGIVAVTKAGALVSLDPGNGAVKQTLVPSGVLGDEISVSGKGIVYYAVANGCSASIYQVPEGGGSPSLVVAGRLPAISPDGTKLAYAVQPGMNQTCTGWDTATPGTGFSLKIMDIASGAATTIPQVPASQPGIPAPISHLSWAPDGQHLAVSIAAVQDNEGWAVNIVDPGQATAYQSGPGVIPVPVTGSPTPQQSYLREGVYLPNGDLFVSRACCGGDPVVNTSRLMWEVQPGGTLVRQVAIGFASTDHVSLDASPDGNWLLYLGGNDLYVSRGGATPSQVTSGLVAAAWT